MLQETKTSCALLGYNRHYLCLRSSAVSRQFCLSELGKGRGPLVVQCLWILFGNLQFNLNEARVKSQILLVTRNIHSLPTALEERMEWGHAPERSRRFHTSLISWCLQSGPNSLQLAFLATFPRGSIFIIICTELLKINTSNKYYL